jgi:tRNA modification GTPase
VIVVNKEDQVKNKWFIVQGIGEPLFISALSGEGLLELLNMLTSEIRGRMSQTGTAPPLTQARHRAALEECREHIARALKASASELRAEDIRLAMRALGRITGHVGVEDLLDIIFRDFCIGK